MFDYTRNNEDETKEMKTHTIWKLKDIKPKRNFNYKKHLSLACQTVTSHDLSVVDQNENHDCLDPMGLEINSSAWWPVSVSFLEFFMAQDNINNWPSVSSSLTQKILYLFEQVSQTGVSLMVSAGRQLVFTGRQNVLNRTSSQEKSFSRWPN